MLQDESNLELRYLLLKKESHSPEINFSKNFQDWRECDVLKF